MNDKTCKTCGESKPRTEFYGSARMADGLFSDCKGCYRTKVLAYRAANIEKVRAYDSRRAKIPERAATSAAISKAWRQEDRRRTAAHSAVAKAIKSGALTQQPCARCGSAKSLAHHEDYDKKLDVIWLCQPCHKQRHKEIAAALKQQTQKSPGDGTGASRIAPSTKE